MILNFLKRKIVWIPLVIVTIGVGGWAMRGPSEEKPTYVTAIVQRTEVVRTVEATGSLASLDEVDLAFETSGVVGEVFVLVGDVVQAGQELARLDQTEAYAHVREASQQVERAQAAIAKMYAGETLEAIAVAEASVDVSSASLAAAQTELLNATEAQAETLTVGAATVATAQVSLDESIDALADTIAQEAEDVVQAASSLDATLQANVIVVRTALSKADEILGIDNSLANNAFQDALSDIDAQQLIWANNAYVIAKQSLDAAELTATVTTVTAALDDAAECLLYVRRALDATTVDNADFSFDDLSTKKAGIDVSRNALQAEVEALLVAEQTVSDAALAQTTAVNTAQHAYASATQALAKAKATQSSNDVAAAAAVRSAQSSVANRTAELAHAQASLLQTQAIPRWVDIAGLEADAQSAKASLSAAQAQLDKTRLLAPIAGVVSAMDVKPGELASAGAEIARVQTTDESRFKLVLDVPESDIALVNLDAAADVTFDALGNSVHVAATVADIDPAEKLLEGVVFYEVTIFLDSSVDVQGLKPGMSSDVTILAAKHDQTLVVPSRSVLERPDGSRYVRIPNADNTSFVERDVKVGLRGDEGKIEILEGVSEGDIVIISVSAPTDL